MSGLLSPSSSSLAVVPRSHQPAAAAAAAAAPLRSCQTCHRRKVRCDKQSPCTPCVRGGRSCTYPEIRSPAHRVRKTTITDVACRISELERTLVSVSLRQRDGRVVEMTATPAATVTAATTPSPPAARRGDTPASLESPSSWDESPTGGEEILVNKGSSARYYDEVLFSRVLDLDRVAGSAVSTDGAATPQIPTASPFNPMGILSPPSFSKPISSYLPSKAVCVRLWKVFVDSIDPGLKVLHIPTDEVTIYATIDEPTKASSQSLALCYASLFAATVALEPPGEQPLILEEDRTVLLGRLKTGLEQAFAHSDLLENPTVVLLQALAIYLGCLRCHNSGRGIWAVNGLAVRCAISIGLHRDGKNLGLPPFESEIRRRLWWRLLSKDARTAEDYGLRTSAYKGSGLMVDMPLNCDDSDLYPGMKELPPPRPGYTRTSLAIFLVGLARAYDKLSHSGWPRTETSRDQFREKVIAEAMSCEYLLSDCNTVIPEQRMAVAVSHLVFRKASLMTCQRDHISADSEMTLDATDEHLIEAIEILEEFHSIWADEMLVPWRWCVRAHPQFHVMLYVLWHLSRKPGSCYAERGLEAVAMHAESIKASDTYMAQDSKWAMIQALQEKVMLMQSARASGAAGASSGTETVCANTRSAKGGNDMQVDESDLFGALPEDMDWKSLLHDLQLDAAEFSHMTYV